MMGVEGRQGNRGLIVGYTQHMFFIGLMGRPGNDDGILLDTQLGVVYWHDAANEFISLSPFPAIFGLDSLHGDEDSEGEPMSPGDLDLREGCEHFYATLKHYLKELHMVPVSKWRVVEGWYRSGLRGNSISRCSFLTREEMIRTAAPIAAASALV